MLARLKPTPSNSDEFARLRELLAPPEKPAVLTLAERTLAKARQDRAKIEERHRAASQRDYASGVLRESRETREIASELAEQDKRIKFAMAAVDQERESLAPAFQRAIGPGCNAAKETIADLLTKLDAVIAPLADLHRFAEGNRLPSPVLVSSVPYLRMAVRELHWVLKGGRA